MKNHIGENITKLRESKKMSQETLGEKIARSRQTISSIENGSTRVDSNMIEQLCEIFECDANIIFGSELMKMEYIYQYLQKIILKKDNLIDKRRILFQILNLIIDYLQNENVKYI